MVLVDALDQVLYALSVRNLALLVLGALDEEASSLSLLLDVKSHSDSSVVLELVGCFGVVFENAEEKVFVRSFD